MTTEIRCRVNNISKNFPGVKALDNVSFAVRLGEIHAIIGENGAGKSTLMNILSGVYNPDAGELEFEGKVRHFTSPREAQLAGIAMIHQELSLFKSLSIYENIFIGRMPKKQTGMIDRETMISESRRFLALLGIDDMNPRMLVKNLSVSQMQLVEIAKAMSLDAKMLIMDEPTSSLTASEIERILKIMDNLRNRGVSIIFITHKLEEVMQSANRITVLRDGRLIETVDAQGKTINELVSLMVGRNFKKASKRDFITDYSDREIVLDVRNLTVPNLVEDCSFTLYRGEVLGLTGLVGAGRSELLQGIFGMYKRTTGTVAIEGEEVSVRNPRTAIERGIGLVPEGRKEQGMFLKLDVKDNMTVVKRRKLTRGFSIINEKKLVEKTREYIHYLSIKTPKITQISTLLSGGNQQKTIIARWLMNDPNILFMDEPTHGIDIGAKAEIYKIIDELVGKGLSIILVSSELPEVLGLCDRVLVMHKVRIVKTLAHSEANEVSIMQHAFNQPEKTEVLP